MPLFKDADTLYAVLRDMFTAVAETNPKAFDDLVKARLTVRFRVSQPTAEVTIDGKTRPPKLTYGAFTGRPDMDLDLTGDNLDKLLRHELNAQKAVMNGTIKFKGNPMKLNAMLAVLKASNTIYPQSFEAHVK